MLESELKLLNLGWRILGSVTRGFGPDCLRDSRLHRPSGGNRLVHQEEQRKSDNERQRQPHTSRTTSRR